MILIFSTQQNEGKASKSLAMVQFLPMSLIDKTATELKELFITKKNTAVEITEAFLNRIEELNPSINAFISYDKELSLDYARKIDAKLAAGETPGKLAGIPIGIKDLINQKDTATTAASKMLKDYKSTFNATITQKVIDEWAIPVGKLNLDEFAMGSGNENSSFGSVQNPWNFKKVPGGSSGGSAAAVAAKMCPIAFGTDTGGSIRQPASYCGIVGMKPTYGRVSRYGIVAFASSLDQAGPMARNVEDCALLQEAMSGYDTSDSTSLNVEVEEYSKLDTSSIKGMKIGVAKEFFTEGLNPEVKAATETAIEKYKELGAEIIEISLDKVKYGLACYYIIAPSEASSNLSRYDGVRFGHRDTEAKNLNDLYFDSRSKFGPEVKRRIMLGVYALSSGYYDAYYKKAQQVRRLISEDFDKAFEQCDLILSPTAPTLGFGAV